MKKPINFSGIPWRNIWRTFALWFILLAIIVIGIYTHKDLLTIFTAILAMVALIVASISLDWATTTMRPYVSRSGDIQIKQSSDYLTIEYQLLNSGRIPASNVSIETNLFGINEKEEVTEDNASKKYPGANDVAPLISVLFPNNKYCLNYTINLKEKLGGKLRDDILAGQVIFRLRIKYRSYGREHLTIQTEQLDTTQGVSHPAIRPVGLQKWT
jgi:hypothetical protein